MRTIHFQIFVAIFATLILASPLANAALNTGRFSLLLPEPYILDADPDHNGLNISANGSVTSTNRTATDFLLKFTLTLTESNSKREVGSVEKTVQMTVAAGGTLRVAEALKLVPGSWLDDSATYDGALIIELSENVKEPRFAAAGSAALASQRIFDSTGSLNFGNVPTVLTSLSGNPVYNVFARLWSLTIGSATANGQALPSGDVLTVANSQGALNVTAGEVKTGDGGPVDYEGWALDLEPTVLNPSGAVALGFKINLPPCIGRIDEATGLLHDSIVTTAPLALDAAFKPLAGAKGTFALPISLVSEEFPLIFQVQDWQLKADNLIFTKPTVEFSRKELFDQWIAVKGELPTSNDAFWFYVRKSIDGDLFVKSGELPGIDVTLDISANLFATHFPLAFIDHDGGAIQIQRSEIVTGSESKITSFTAHVPYGQGCRDPLEPHAIPEPLVDFQVTGDALYFTPETGLYGDGTVGIQPPPDPEIVVVTNVLIGQNKNGQAVHETSTFAGKPVTFYAPMTRIWGDPHVHINSSVTVDANFEIYDYPGAYQHESDSVYAGANVDFVEGLTGRSRVGGDDLGPFPMGDHMKLYMRTSGVSGIFGADEVFLPQALEVGDFDLTIDDWEFSALSNEQHESDIQGSLAVPYPSDFTVAFDELYMNCCGNFEEIVLAPGQSDVQLKYWNRSEIEIKNIEFVSADDCATEDPALKVAVEAQINGVPGDRTGVLYILDTGRLSNADHATYPASFLELAPNFELAGGFRSMPVRHAYFNNFDEWNTGEDLGFINLIVATKAPFFDAMNIHATTNGFDLLGNEAIENQQVRMNGGWESDSKTHFSHEDFDSGHIGWPKSELDADEDPTDYWESDSANYVAEAKRQIWIAPFDFDVKYDPLTCTFNAISDKGFDLAGVINANANLARLTKDETEITFGAGFNLNLSNALESLVASGAGIATTAIFEQIDFAFDNVDDFLQARICDLIEVELTESINAHISNKLLEALKDSDGQLSDQEIDDHVEACVITEIENLNLGGEILAKIDAKLASIEAGLTKVEEFLTIIPPTHIEAFAGASLDGLPCDVGEIAGIKEDLSASLGDTGFGARIAALRDRVVELKGFVAQLRSGTGFALEIETIINDGIDNLNATYGMTVKDALRPFLREVVDELAQFPQGDYELANFEARIAVDLGDLICSMDFMAEFQAIVRARIRLAVAYAMKQLVASAFQQIGLFVADVSAEAIVNCSGIGAALDAVASFSDAYIKAGKFWGHAIISHEELELLRLDGEMVIQSQPIPIRLHPFFEWRSLNSDGSKGCNPALVPIESKEVLVGAIVSPAFLSEEGNNVTLSSQFSFAQPVGQETWKPIGFMGKIEINAGGNFAQPLRFDYLSAMFAVSGDGSGTFGNFEMYLAGEGEATINSNPVSFVPYSNYKLYGGLFIGQTCSADPLHWASQSIQDSTPLLGAVAFGAGSFPFYDIGCLLRIKAKAGFEVFGFEDSSLAGGRVGAKISGEASGDLLCLLSAKGSIDLSTQISFAGDAAFSGSACLKGKVGPCPFCKKFDGCLSTSFSTGNGFGADF
ncbi:MAG: hypothetical protein ACI9R3_002658 [Verrucomicrobiales bacterium]|jgi:hypothetical protein